MHSEWSYIPLSRVLKRITFAVHQYFSFVNLQSMKFHFWNETAGTGGEKISQFLVGFQNCIDYISQWPMTVECCWDTVGWGPRSQIWCNKLFIYCAVLRNDHVAEDQSTGKVYCWRAAKYLQRTRFEIHIHRYIYIGEIKMTLSLLLFG